jgi:predicted O-methyltransferase YrrM
MVLAVYCLARYLRPVKVVDTGVGRGLTSRVILESLERNGAGHLWSIDLPPLLYPELAAEVGAAVEERNRHRWSYIKGSSRRCLPGLLNALGAIDLFVHDSIHTEYNTRFELDSSWRALSPGGAVIVDDIDLNPAFHAFAQSPHVSFVCAAKPLQPDPSRYDGKGLFGIVLKNVGHAR